MPVTPEDRPLDALREETIDRLITNYGHGRLSLEAFQRRLDEAFDASGNAELIALTRDLDLAVDSLYVAARRKELAFPESVRTDVDDTDEAPRDVEYMIHVFGGGDRSGEWTPARELRIITVFGGCQVDFTNAHFAARTTRIKLVCLFGGVEIFVPDTASVSVNAFCLFGGVANKARNRSSGDGPRLVVEGLVMFGGTDVKVRKSFKQRIQEFADGVRGAFGPSSPSPPG